MTRPKHSTKKLHKSTALSLVKKHLKLPALGIGVRAAAAAIAALAGDPAPVGRKACWALVFACIETNGLVPAKQPRPYVPADPFLRLALGNNTQPDPALFQWANGDSFLRSYQWRKLRMEVLTQRGARCEACGATPAHGVVLHVDHIKPRRRYPALALEPSNLQVLCEVCNHGKGNWDETDWRRAEAKPVTGHS